MHTGNKMFVVNFLKIIFPFLASVTLALHISVTNYRSETIMYSKRAGGIPFPSI